MNFDKLHSELKVTLLKLNDEIEKNTKIEEENIKLNDENIKLNQNFESIIKTLNQLQNDMIIVKKDSKDKSEEIKRLIEVLKIQYKININLQKQINETEVKEKEKLIEENKKLREDYDKILSFFNN